MADERLEALRLRDRQIGEEASRRTHESGAMRKVERHQRLRGIRRRLRLSPFLDDLVVRLSKLRTRGASR